ncbi:hypothetical protein [Streptomyces sp. NPDC020681]|uniref:hypothetical protein n=1 Tax=Streptomyces sp. NPDC020681 TaxID=3365083 RepID=UPI00378A9CE7
MHGTKRRNRQLGELASAEVAESVDMSGGIGPVEPAGGGWPAEPAEIIGDANSGRPASRWHRPALVGAVAAALALAAAQLFAERPAPAPEPAPGLVTRIAYQGMAGQPDVRAHVFTLGVGITVVRGSPVTVQSIRQPYAMMRTSVRPEPPFDVRPGTTRYITLRVAVRSCAGIPRDMELPFLDVTLRSRGAVENTGFVLSRAYSDDLAEALRTICPQPATRSTGAP